MCVFPGVCVAFAHIVCALQHALTVYHTDETTIEGAALGGLILSNAKWLSVEPSPFHAASKEIVIKRLQMLSELPSQEPFVSRACSCMCQKAGTPDQVPITKMQRTRCGCIQPGHKQFWARAVVLALLLVALACLQCALVLHRIHARFRSISPDPSHAGSLPPALTLSLSISPTHTTTRPLSYQADPTSNITRPPTVVSEAHAAFAALEEDGELTITHGGDDECAMNVYAQEEFDVEVMQHTSYNKQVLKEKRGDKGDDSTRGKKAKTSKEPETKTQQMTRLLKTVTGASKKQMVAYIEEVGGVSQFKEDGCTVADAKELKERLRGHLGIV